MKPLKLTLLLTIPLFTASANWRNEVGWSDLQTWTQEEGVILPVTNTVFAGMVEAENGSDKLSIYAPNPSESEFNDITINDVYGETLTYSGHATGVAKRFFGNQSSISPDILQANVYGTNRFLNLIISYPSSWSENVMSHAYIGNFADSIDSETEEVTETKEQKSERFCRAFDYSAAEGNILHISGANNNSSTTLPHIWSHAYNNITIGRSDGLHSAGTVPSNFHGEKRQKPELVFPATTTSSSTGSCASIAAVLHAQAQTHDSSLAQQQLTLKSILLAGADKSKFPNWSNTSTKPIDVLYGAGEINILNSFRILLAADAQKNTDVPRYGWDHTSITAAESITYAFSVPDYASSATISANLSWNRTVTRTRSGRNWISSYDSLSNLSLTITNSSGTPIFVSDSPYDNLEHIWLENLAPGNYTLEVNMPTGNDTTFALAWRVDLKTNAPPQLTINQSGDYQIQFSQLSPNHTYRIERSNNLIDWFTLTTSQSDAQGSLLYSEPSPLPSSQNFYRLRYFSP
ncbi:hypothetical protein [Rubritalea tangerina]|uniref:Peptidase S8/S53 domain-containing protein n=1 Tax=Rubritalea tangerina TaxID=430798 RepID=A0ABW4ZBY6_9BACT